MLRLFYCWPIACKYAEWEEQHEAAEFNRKVAFGTVESKQNDNNGSIHKILWNNSVYGVHLNSAR